MNPQAPISFEAQDAGDGAVLPSSDGLGRGDALGALLLIVEEPRHDDGRIDNQPAHRR